MPAHVQEEMMQMADGGDVSSVSQRISGDNEADWMLDQLHLPKHLRSRGFTSPRPINFDQVPSVRPD